MTKPPAYDSVDACMLHLNSLPDKFRKQLDRNKCHDKMMKINDLVNELEMVLENLQKLYPVAGLELEGTFDEARNMAHTLRDIHSELKECAQCKGDHVGGYSIDRLLPNLCEIMYRDFGECHNSKYN